MDERQPKDETAASSSSRSGLVGVPAFQAGGLVERTGIALVHQGEYILPAPGSEAVITASAEARTGQVINYYFPVEVQLVGQPTDDQMRRIADFVYDELMTAFGAV